MDAIAELSWRVYPSAALMAIGLAVSWLGSRMARRGFHLPGAADMQMFIKGFRIAVIGGTIAALGAAWNWQLTWLLVLSLVICGEEVVETTLHLSILRWKPGAGKAA